MSDMNQKRMGCIEKEVSYLEATAKLVRVSTWIC